MSCLRARHSASDEAKTHNSSISSQHSITEPLCISFTNSVDPDDMQHYAAFHLGLHYLQKYSFKVFRNTKGLTKAITLETFSPRILSKHAVPNKTMCNHQLRT